VARNLAGCCQCERGIFHRPAAKAAEPGGKGYGDRGAAVGDQRAAVRALRAKRRSPPMTRPSKAGDSAVASTVEGGSCASNIFKAACVETALGPDEPAIAFLSNIFGVHRIAHAVARTPPRSMSDSLPTRFQRNPLSRSQRHERTLQRPRASSTRSAHGPGSSLCHARSLTMEGRCCR
jgi:hypothetical protein